MAIDLTEHDDGGRIQARVGDMLEVRLPEIASSGYRWSPEDLDTSLFELNESGADGPGWGSFDVSAVRAPAIVLHGREDSIVDVAQAAHTASLVPGARLEVVDGLAHLSIVMRIPATLAELSA